VQIFDTRDIGPKRVSAAIAVKVSTKPVTPIPVFQWKNILQKNIEEPTKPGTLSQKCTDRRRF